MEVEGSVEISYEVWLFSDRTPFWTFSDEFAFKILAKDYASVKQLEGAETRIYKIVKTICLEENKKLVKWKGVIDCNHSFCKSCTIDHLRSSANCTCPLCRNDILYTNEEEEEEEWREEFDRIVEENVEVKKEGYSNSIVYLIYCFAVVVLIVVTCKKE